MLDALLENEPYIRLSFFFGVLFVVAIWETLAPRRQRTLTRLQRWPSNIGIVAINTLILRILFPVAAVGMAFAASEKEWGLMHLLDLPPWLEILLAVILLDLAIYLQHVLVHAVPALWRLHRMHHADMDYDVTTGARFHPIEIIFSMVLKLGVVAAIGASPEAVIIFEVMLNAMAMFNHGNISLPPVLDKALRFIVVTPDMHRVHHSIKVNETNSNYGFNLPWWDRLFGTYRAQPTDGHKDMTIGLTQFRETADQRLDRMLLQPFQGETGTYPINRRTFDDG